ncbi:hypothetical protein Hanom_Chr06g00498881 [Helianthus anomalus]
MWNLIYFQSITYFLYFFSLCALFLRWPTLFLRLDSRRGRCASPAPCVFDNIACIFNKKWLYMLQCCFTRLPSPLPK